MKIPRWKRENSRTARLVGRRNSHNLCLRLRSIVTPTHPGEFSCLGLGLFAICFNTTIQLFRTIMMSCGYLAVLNRSRILTDSRESQTAQTKLPSIIPYIKLYTWVYITPCSTPCFLQVSIPPLFKSSTNACSVLYRRHSIHVLYVLR